MNLKQHRTKAEDRAFDAKNEARRRAIIEATMLAGSRWLYFACHRIKLTERSTPISLKLIAQLT